MAKRATEKTTEQGLSTEEQFWLDYPDAPCLLKVGDAVLLQSSEGKAKDLARMSGVEIEVITNPKLKPTTDDAS